MKNIIYSHSGIKAYETCPRKYYEEKVIKLHPAQETEATNYGKRFHKAAEDFIKDGTPIPDEFIFSRKLLGFLRDRKGQKYPELEMAVDINCQPVSFKAENAWIRGIADLVIVHGDKAYVADYKTGNDKYPDKDQLVLMSLMVFAHFPQVNSIKSALLFVLKNTKVDGSMLREDAAQHWQNYRERTALIKRSSDTGTWNPRQNGLCRKYCPCTGCPHNGGG